MNTYELEIAILTAIWSMDKIDLEQFSGDLFVEREKYDKIIQYRKQGNPAGDIVLSMGILGNDLTKELISNQSRVVETSIKHYIRQLKILTYKSKLFNEISKGELSKEILEEGMKIYNPVEEDGNLYDLSGDLQDYIKDLEKRINKEVISYNLGYKKLDEYIAPIEPGTFLIVKALKKTGKTNFAMNVFRNMVQRGIPCLYITSEMGYFKLIDKLVSIVSDVKATSIRKGDVTNKELVDINESITNNISGKCGFIYQSGMFDMEKINELLTKTNAKVCFIDYVQMFKIGDSNRAESLEKIACQIKDIAMTRGVVCIGMSQVNKEGDTKHCLSFEEKADQVITLKTKEDSSPYVKLLDVSVDFNRYGSTGNVSMVLKRSNCLIAEMDTTQVEEEKDYKNIYK